MEAQHYTLFAQDNFEARINNASRMAMSSYYSLNYDVLDQSTFRYYPQPHAG